MDGDDILPGIESNKLPSGNPKLHFFPPPAEDSFTSMPTVVYLDDRCLKNNVGSSKRKKRQVGKIIDYKSIFPVKQHPCDKCDKVFITSTFLKQHQIKFHQESKAASESAINTASATKKSTGRAAKSVIKTISAAKKSFGRAAKSVTNAVSTTKQSNKPAAKTVINTVSTTQPSNEPTVKTEINTVSTTKQSDESAAKTTVTVSTDKKSFKHAVKNDINTVPDTEKSTQYACDICNRVCTTLSYLKTHRYQVHLRNKTVNTISIISHDKTTQTLLTCDICDKVCATKGHLKIHKFHVHKISKVSSENVSCTASTIEKTPPHVPDNCYKICNIPSHLEALQFQAYIRNKIANKKTITNTLSLSEKRNKHIVCEICGKVCATKGNMKTHKFYIHKISKTAQENAPCTPDTTNKTPPQHVPHTNDKICSTPSRWRDHRFQDPQKSKIANQETITNPISLSEKRNKHIVCEICGKACATQGNMKIHKLFIHNIRSVKPVATQASVKPVPSIGKTPPVHVCDICDKVCASPWHLRAHQVYAHQKSPISNKYIPSNTVEIRKISKSYVCETCGKVCATASYLKTHQIVHRREKSHACKICGSRFFHLSNLKKHKAAHKLELKRNASSSSSKKRSVTGS